MEQGYFADKNAISQGDLLIRPEILPTLAELGSLSLEAGLRSIQPSEAAPTMYTETVSVTTVGGKTGIDVDED